MFRQLQKVARMGAVGLLLVRHLSPTYQYQNEVLWVSIGWGQGLVWYTAWRTTDAGIKCSSGKRKLTDVLFSSGKA